MEKKQYTIICQNDEKNKNESFSIQGIEFNSQSVIIHKDDLESHFKDDEIPEFYTTIDPNNNSLKNSILIN